MPTTITRGAMSASAYGLTNGFVKDPNFSSVAILCHFDGTNGSTNFVDNSSHALTMTPSGTAQLTTSQFKFGSSAGTNGTGSISFTLASSIGTQAWTLEGWVYFTSGAVIGFWGPTGLVSTAPSLRTNSTLLECYTTGGAEFTSATHGFTLNAWNALAATSNGSTLSLYANGTRIATNASWGINLTNTTYRFGQDRNSAGDNNVIFDEGRLTIGVQRYSGASYTVPTAPFPNS